MELTWSTFILEIINFLVLVWILKRFFYRPVLAVIARRRAGIESTLAEARAMQDKARALQQQYESRLGERDRERQQERDAMLREIEEERGRRLAQLQEELETEREKARVSEARRRADTERHLEEVALEQGARFATRLLQQGAGADLETRLVELALEDLAALPRERGAALRNDPGSAAAEAIVVTTAFVLPQALQQRLEQVLRDVIGRELPVRFARERALIAGIRITVGPWVLGMNLQDELKGFAAIANDPATA